MAIELTDLRPYKSILIATVVPPEAAATPSGPIEPISLILDAFRKTLDNEEDAITVHDRLSTHALDDESVVGFLAYSERRRPAWLAETSDSDILDLEHHLLLLCHHQQHVAALLTDKRRKRKLGTSIRQLDGLALVSARELRSAFIRGPALALWMEGIHPPVTIKPDSKTLFGQNLRDAIDPLGDQTYMVSAARSRVHELGLAVGSSPRSSRIWIGPSHDWSDCISTLVSILNYLEEDPPEDPLPFVPRTVDPDHVLDLQKAYEIHILPPELLGDVDDLDANVKEVMERWAYESRMVIKARHDDHLIVGVDLHAEWLADVRLKIDFEDPANVGVKPEIADQTSGADDDLLEELKKVFEHSRWLRMWFHSGETLVNGQLCTQQYLELPFRNYQWEDFSAWDVKTEKFWTGSFPDDPHATLDASDSLFSWVKAHWPGTNSLSSSRGWLACDDGSMEIADFIHLDTDASPPVLSLIHVKAAKSKDKDRTLSVASYQIVISQALRNLRYLYRENVSKNFLDGLTKKISKLVWHNGKRSDREKMVAALSSAAGNYRRQVVVLQPQVTLRRLDAVRDNDKHRDYAALQQLDTLFLATAESCRQLQAAFTVVCDEVPPLPPP